MAAVSLCALAGVAQATDELHLDINNMTVQAKDSVGGSAISFDPSLSGVLEFSFDSSTLDIDELLDIFGSSTFVDHGAQVGFSDITGHLAYSAGGITGGSFVVTVSGETYTANIKAGSGFIAGGGGDPYVIHGSTFDGIFSDTSFGTVDVSKYVAGQPLAGRLWQFEFNPTAGGLDANGELDVYILVPLPPAAYAGFGMLAGVMGLSYVLRRR